jgi:hypothetical protein
MFSSHNNPHHDDNRTMPAGPTEQGQQDDEPRNHHPAPVPAIVSNCSHGGEQLLMVGGRKGNEKEAQEMPLTSLGP